MGWGKQDRDQNFIALDCLCSQGEMHVTGFTKRFASDSKLHTVTTHKMWSYVYHWNSTRLLQWAAEFTAKWKWRGVETWHTNFPFMSHTYSLQCPLLSTMPWKCMWECRYTPCSLNLSTVWRCLVIHTFWLLVRQGNGGSKASRGIQNLAV
jgi:hypothetical protein